MKKILIAIILLGSITVAKAQKMWKQLPLTKISDTIYIDETEVNIKDWVTYLSDLIYNNPQIEINKYLPDTNKIKKECRFYFKPFFNPTKIQFTLDDTPDRAQLLFFPQATPSNFEEKYFVVNNNKIAMSEVPITGITFEQAKDYCKWRTTKINFIIFQYNGVIPKEYRGKKITVRLITPKEFVKYSGLYGYRQKGKIIEKNYQEIYKIDSIVPGNNCITFLYNSKNGCHSYVDYYGYGPAPVAAFFSTFLTTYDWFGNVAEITSTKGIAKGGSFFHYAKEANPLNNIQYENSEEWLGFRCIFQVE